MEMSDSTIYQFHIDKNEKAEPFPIEYTPNEKTAKILLASDAVKDYKRADSVDSLLAAFHS